jgi:hypothetical protein
MGAAARWKAWAGRNLLVIVLLLAFVLAEYSNWWHARAFYQICALQPNNFVTKLTTAQQEIGLICAGQPIPSLTSNYENY